MLIESSFLVSILSIVVVVAVFDVIIAVCVECSMYKSSSATACYSCCFGVRKGE